MAAHCGARADKSGRRGGGCAFCGAKMSLQPIADAIHLVHGPANCLGHTWDSRPTASSGPTLHRTTITTDLSETDIVLGGEAKLVRAIETLAAERKPAALFVYQTCLPAMSGDDLVAACRRAAARVAVPVIPVPCSGLDGGKDHGNRTAGEVLLEHVIGRHEPDILTIADINLIGEYNVAGELRRVKPLLAGLGIRVLASIPGDGRYGAIASAHRARAAIALCSRALGGLAEKMEARHGIPFVRGSFYGCAAISETLRAIAGLLAARGGPAGLPARAEMLIGREEARLEAALAPYRARLAGKRALLATGGVKAWSLAAMLQHIGLEVVATSVHKTSFEERCRAAALVGEAGLADGLSMAAVRASEVDVVLSGGMARFEVMRLGVPWVEINHERRMTLSGYDGTLRLAAEIDRAIHHPVWLSLKASTPWDRPAAPLAQASGR